MRATATILILSLSCLLAPRAASAQAARAVIDTAGLEGPFEYGLVEERGEHLVLAFNYRGGSGWNHAMTVRLDGFTPVARFEGARLDSLRVFERSVLWSAGEGKAASGELRGLDGARLAKIEGELAVADPDLLYAWADGTLRRYDVATGAPRWELALGERFAARVTLAAGASGVWVGSADMGSFVFVTRDGEEAESYTVPGPEAGHPVAMDVLTLPDRDHLVLALGSWSGRKGELGTLFRLLGGLVRPKEFFLPDPRAYLLAAGRRSADVSNLVFRRRGKWFAAVAGSQGRRAGDQGTVHAVDVKRWKPVVDTPSVNGLVGDLGYAEYREAILDRASGKKVAKLDRGETWVEMSEQYAYAWDADARQLRLLPLDDGERRTIAFAEAEELSCLTPRFGDALAVWTRRTDGTCAVDVIDPASGQVTRLAEGQDLTLVGLSTRVVPGRRMWVLVGAGHDRRMKLELYEVAGR